MKLAGQKGILYYKSKMVPISNNPDIGNVKNYIIFNDEMWRIIGAFKQLKGNGETEWLLKIIKDKPLSNDSLPSTTYTYNGVDMVLKDATETRYGYYYWNYDNYFNEKSDTDWTTSALQYYLNDEVNPNSYYNSIDDSYKNMIETVVYNLGNVSYSDTSVQAYNNEKNGLIDTGNYETWTGKIGLMYPSDYGYSSLSSYWETAKLVDYDLLSKKIGDYHWMRDEIKINELTISHKYSIDINYSSIGYFTETGVVSPVLYLKSNVRIMGGTGEYSNPYTLE